MKTNHKFNLSWTTVFAAAMFGMLLFGFVNLIALDRGQLLYSNYGIALIFITAGVYFTKKRFIAPLEIKIFIVYLVWALITRWINRDLYLSSDYFLIVGILLTFLFFCVGTVLSEKQRTVLLDCVSLIFIAVFIPAALAGIFTCVTGTYINLPPENSCISIITQGTLNSLNMFSISRLYAVTWFFITWCLLVYQFFKRRNSFVRFLIIVCIVICHITIPLFHSRNIQICLSCCYGMLGLLVFIKLLNNKPLKIRAVALPAITVASAVLCFFSFNPCLSFISNVRSVAEPEFRAFYEARESKLDPKYFGIEQISSDESSTAATAKAAPQESSSTESHDFTDSRSIAGNFTLTYRTLIWKSGLIVIRENPSIALYGCLSKDVMPPVNDILHNQFKVLVGSDMPTMHNVFFETLMFFGIPGLIMALLWTVLIVKKMLIVFFSDDKTFSTAEKALTLPIAGIFIFNLAESIIFSYYCGLTGHIFFLVSGLLLGCFYEKSKNSI